jgi:phosphonoacetaldehyde hydrolase
MDLSSSRYTGAIKAVLADLAGTTVDFGSCAPAGTFVELFRRHDVAVTTEEARGPMGIQKREHIRAMLHMPNIAKQWQHLHGRQWTEEDLDVLYREFVPMQMDVLPHYSDVIAGVPETVAELRRRRIRVGVSTGYDRQMLALVLAKAADGGFEPEAAVCAADVPEGRPAPWMNLRLMEQLDTHPAAAVVCIGDTIADIKAGLNAGAWTVGVTRTGNLVGLTEQEWNGLATDEQDQCLAAAEERLTSAGAHYVVDSFAALPAVIGKIETRLRHGEKATTQLVY